MKILILLLHGSGDTGRNLRDYLDCIPIGAFDYKTFGQVISLAGIDLLCPTATTKPYTPNLGMPSSVWFDRSSVFASKGTSDTEDLNGAESSLLEVIRLIEANEASYDHIFLGGFSMGGCLSLHMLRKDSPPKLRGIFTMGSFLVDSSQVIQGQLGSASANPILMMHGLMDSRIRFEWGKRTATNLLLRNLNVVFREYEKVDHEIAELELVDLLHWVQDVVSTIGDSGGNFLTVSSRLAREDEMMAENNTFSERNQIVEGVSSAGIFVIQENGNQMNSYRITFTSIPVSMIPIIIQRSVLVNGGSFDLLQCESGVFTDVVSSDPHALALEIAKRLEKRLRNGGNMMDPCPIS